MKIESLFENAQRAGSRNIIDGPTTLTYGDVNKRCVQLNAFLHECGLRQGARVAIVSSDEVESSAFILCCFRLGFPVAVIDPGAKKSELDAIFGKLQPRAIFIDQDLMEMLPEGNPDRLTVPVARPKKKLINRLLGKERESPQTYPACLPLEEKSTDLPSAPDPSQTALYLCTSGTTGLPKILQLSYANLFAAATTTSNQLRFTSSARVLNLLPLTHYDGTVSGLFTTFWNTATIIRLGPFTISLLPDTFDAIYKYRATHLLLTPSILALMLRLSDEVREAFQSEEFQFVISVAASLLPKLWSDFESKTGKRIVNVYGLSETGNNLFAGPDDDSHCIGSIGKPADCGAMIVDDGGRQMPTGSSGELLLDGESITSGYLGSPVTTTTVNGKNWFATGDIAYCDGAGVYWLAGRKKNIIIVGGRNVYPDEVNNALLQHPSVVEAATVGVPDEIWGERVVSFVVINPEAGSQEVTDHAAKFLTEYKIPREIHIVPELPKGRSGKVLVNELLQQWKEGSFHKSQEMLEKLEEQVLRLASESFRVPVGELSPQITPQTCSRWDSVAHMDLVVNLETKFGIELLPREVIQIVSLESAIRIVRQKLST